MTKTLINSDFNSAKKNVPDIKTFGNANLFRLLAKASSENEGWMKSTKAMQTPRGCLVQVTTQQGEMVSEALTFVKNVRIVEDKQYGGRKLVNFSIFHKIKAIIGLKGGGGNR
jgi:hypothetical protein